MTIKDIRYSAVSRAALLISVLWIAGASAANAASDETFLPLIKSMAERLVTADQVALNKWDSGGAVYAPKRELQVVANVKDLASNYGLSSDDAANIFTDQMEANKELQYSLLNNWRRNGSAPTTPRQSLAEVIRPLLDKMQTTILKNLQDVGPARSSVNCPSQVASAAGKVAQQNRFDVLHLAALDRAVARICVASE